jgi:hypothetical protein
MEKFAGPIELTDAELMAVAGGETDTASVTLNGTEASTFRTGPLIGAEVETKRGITTLSGPAPDAEAM